MDDNENKIENSESNKPKNTPFRQQKLKGWKPNITIWKTLCVQGSFSIFSLTIGIIIITSMQAVREEVFDQTEKSKNLGKWDVKTGTCINNDLSNCTIDFRFELKEKWDSEVLLMYQLMDFQANHRKFILSRSWKQLKGDQKSENTTHDLINTCGGVSTYENLYSWQQDLLDMNRKEQYKEIDQPDDQKEYNRSDPNIKNMIAIPCGLAAKQMFYDKFELYTIYDESGNNKSIQLNFSNLVWDSYTPNIKGLPYYAPSDWKKYAWIKIDSQHFISWMITPGRNDFRKVWARINGLDKGKYLLRVFHHTDISKFGARKLVVISTQNIFGAKNNFLGIIFCILGSLSALVMPCFIVKQFKVDKQMAENKDK